jgi:hypothetical protein
VPAALERIVTPRKIRFVRQTILNEPLPVKKPSILALLLGIIPLIGMCFSVPLWDRIHPMILGLPSI